MVAKLTRLTHKITIKLHLVAKSCTIYSSRSRRPVRKLLGTPSYMKFYLESLKERDHLGDLVVDVSISGVHLREIGNGFKWPRMESRGGLL
jgi:hypothetical protein